jgi:N6-adenosine-specific RNA methylase IME4
MARKAKRRATAPRGTNKPLNPHASETYGELREDLFFTGLAFERGCQRLRKLLSGDDWKRCGNGFKEVDVFLNSLKLDQFARITEERREIKRLIKELRPEVSVRTIGRALKVPHTTMDRIGAAEAKLPQSGAAEAKKANENNKGLPQSGAASFSGADAARVLARAERVKDNQQVTSERIAKVAFDARQLGKYSLILADPPWDDEFGTSNRSIENHYPTMKFEDILGLPVSEIAHDQAMLFLWATPSMIEMALMTVKAWGFNYRTQMIWVKPSIGLGKYVRQKHEIMLICRRGGHPAPEAENLSQSVIEAPRGEHSEKPEIFHEIIERMYPAAEKIELFRRGQPRKGWTAWGNQTDALQAAE